MTITLIMVDAMTVARIEARALAYHGLRPSVDTSSTLPSNHGTDRRPTSRNTLGKRTLDYGSRIIDLLDKLVERIMMISLSATFHCSWPIRRERG